MSDPDKNPTRRDFFGYTPLAMGLVGLGSVFWALTDTMNPDANTLAAGLIDLSSIQPGQRKIEVWQGTPIVIFRRTSDDLQQIRAENWHSLRDPQSDESRVHKGHDEWLVLK